MEKLFEEQPEVNPSAPSEAAAEAVERMDSDAGAEGAGEGQPLKKWAKMFDSPEKLEDAYGHIYRAYHAKCRELQQTTQALDGLVGAFGHGGDAGMTGGQVAGGGFAPQAATGLGKAGFGREGVLLDAVAQAQAEALQARRLGERFVVTSLENQARDFFKSHSELGEGEGAFERFAHEVSTVLGPVDVESLHRMPEALERAFRIVTYPEAVRDAAKREDLRDSEAERFVVEGGGAGSLSVPRNQARETSFRALVQRLKREAGLE